MKTTMKFIYLAFTSLALACFTLSPTVRAVNPPPDGGYPGFNTAEGLKALFSRTTGQGNTAAGWYSLFSDTDGSFNTAVGAGTLVLNIGNQAMGQGVENTATGAAALLLNTMGADNTAIGSTALLNNDSDAAGLANNNTAIGAQALRSDIDGSENTAVGTGAGANVVAGFNNTYVGDFVGTLASDESSTIRIGDLSNGNGNGSEQCYIGGIFNNFQPVGGSVVEVTLDLANDHLGWDVGPSNKGGVAPVKRTVPLRRSAPGTATRTATLNGKGKVEKLEAMVAQQQKQIETLTAQLKEQAAQIQKVSAQLAGASPSLADLK